MIIDGLVAEKTCLVGMHGRAVIQFDARQDGGRRCLCECFFRLAQEIAPEQHIVIDEQHVRAGHLLQSHVAVGAKTAPGTFDMDDVRKIRSDHMARGFVGAVIGDDHFVRRRMRRCNGAEGARKIVRAVACADADRDSDIAHLPAMRCPPAAAGVWSRASA